MEPQEKILKDEIGFRKVVYAKAQEEYQDLAGLQSPDGNAVLFRYKVSPEELEALKNGGSIFIQVLTFGKVLQPIMPYVEFPESFEPKRMLVDWISCLSR